MIRIQLWGTPQCRRYQKMRTAVLKAAAELGLEIDLEEINTTDQLSQLNPLDLPRLVANGVVIASRNPPKTSFLQEQFQHVIEKKE
jgi:hypothetical protein